MSDDTGKPDAPNLVLLQSKRSGTEKEKREVPPNGTLITALETLLEQAKKGEVLEMSSAWVDKNGLPGSAVVVRGVYLPNGSPLVSPQLHSQTILLSDQVTDMIKDNFYSTSSNDDPESR